MAQAIYYVNGVQKFNAKCGQTIVFDIPGYQQIWLTQYQNGVLVYDGIYNLPAAPYQLKCNDDVGTFQGTAWELINGQKGNVVATWTFQINPQDSGPPTGPPTPPQNPCLTGLCTPNNPTNPPPGGGGGFSPTVPYVPGPGVSPGGGGLSPFGDLPGSIPSATLGGSSGQPVPGGPPEMGFDWMGFIRNHLFWLLIALLVLVWLMTKDGKGRG